MATEIFDDANLERSDLINKLKEEFKIKLENMVRSAKEQMNKSAVSALGFEFASLVNQRKKLIADYSENTKKLLNYAIKCGMHQEVKDLSAWSKAYDKSKEMKGRGTQLLNAVISKVQLINPDIVNLVKESERLLKENNDQIVALVKSKRPALLAIQKEARAQLQKQLIELVLEFKNKVKVINQSFGVENAEVTLPSLEKEHELTLSFTDDPSSEDQLFIPSESDEVN